MNNKKLVVQFAYHHKAFQEGIPKKKIFQGQNVCSGPQEEWHCVPASCIALGLN